MPELISLPTQQFKTRADMLADQATAPWSKKRWVVINEDELYGGGMSFHYFSNEVLTLINAVNLAKPIGLPPGGLPGQLLAKESEDDFDAVWIDPPVSTVETFALLIKPGVRLKIKPGTNLKIH